MSMETELGLSQLDGALGIAVYAWAFGFAPLLLAPLSEEFGRSALYWVSCFFVAGEFELNDASRGGV